MPVTHEKKTNHHHVIIDEQILNEQTGDVLKNTMLGLMRSGVKNFSLDFSKTVNLDKTGLTKMLFLQQKLSNEKGTMKIVSISSELETLFQAIQLDKVLTIESIPGTAEKKNG